MNPVDQLEKTLEIVRSIGYEVHYDWFGGTGGGACQLGNRKCLFLDLAMNAEDHLVMAENLLAEVAPGSKAA